MRLCNLLCTLALACGPNPDNEDSDDTDSSDTSEQDTGEPGEGEDAIVLLDSVRPGSGPIHIMDMDVTGTSAYLAAYSGIIQMDVSTPSNLSVTNAPGERKLYWTDVSDDMLLVSGRENGVRLIRLRENGSMNAGNKYKPSAVYTEGVHISGERAYVALQSQGVAILSLPQMEEQQRLSFATNAVDLLAHKNYLYVSDRDQGLVVIDMTTPEMPTLAATLSLPTSPQQLLIHDTTLYIAASSNLLVIDIANPFEPKLIRALPTMGLAQRLDLSGSYLAVANWHDTRVYDVTDPHLPTIIAVEASEESSMSVDIEGDTLFVGDWDDIKSYAFDGALKSPELSLTSTITVTGEPGTEEVGLTIHNEGNMWLKLESAACTAPEMRFVSGPTALAPGDQDLMIFSLDIIHEDPVEYTCAIQSNDADEGTKTVTFRVNPAGLGVGDPAPDFSLSDLTGTGHTLSEHLGKAVMISIFSSL